MTKLAQKYGLSDVELRKKCKELMIPLPPAGYWQKKQYGKAPPRPPLPLLEEEEEITIRAKDEEPSLDDEQLREAAKRIAFEKLPKNRIHVPHSLHSPHPYMRRTLEELKDEEPSWFEDVLLRGHRKGCLDIRVSPASLKRGLRILDALLKALESRGFQVSISGSKYAMNVTLLGETISFAPKEGMRQVKRDEKKNQKLPSWERRTYDLVPTGTLSLTIESYVWGSRKRWSDGKNRKVEECLNSFIIGLIRGAVAMRRNDLRIEVEHRKREELMRHREEEIRLQKEEEKRFQDLLTWSDNWHKSRRLREFLDAVREDALRKWGKIEQGSELDEWLK